MNYNINGMSLSNFKNREEGDILFDKFLNKEKPDIICFQEFTNSKKGLEYHIGRFDYLKKMNYLTRTDDNTTVVLSKFPISETGNVPFENSNGSNGCTFMNVKIKDKKLRLYNLHLESNRVSGRAEELASDRKINKQKLFDIKSILGSVRKFSKIRTKQTDVIVSRVIKEKLPTIVCGDFNEPPLSYSYHKFASNLNDAFSTCGCGFGTTYAGNIPGLKIDHIFYNDKVTMLSTSIKKVPFSDHYPTVSKFKLE
jgi:endonuclease/exonuclease/phosphatase family metal-dependent hydrolase